MSELRIKIEVSIDKFLYTYLRKQKGISENRTKTLMRDLKSDDYKLSKLQGMLEQVFEKRIRRSFLETDFTHLEGIGPTTSYKAARGIKEAILLLRSNNSIEKLQMIGVKESKRKSSKKKKGSNDHIGDDYFSI